MRTALAGADYATGPVVAGLSVARSWGHGGYSGVSAGRVTSAVTGFYPWLGYRASERVTVWGMGGYGAGGLLLTPEGSPALEADLSMKMTAAGARGELLASSTGFGLAFKADALWVKTATGAVDGPGGRLAASAAAVTRLRTALEGSRAFRIGGRASLTPSVEAGLRHDAATPRRARGWTWAAALRSATR